MNLIQDFKKKNANLTKFIPLDNFVYSVHISLKHRYIYVETPKVCCSTIKTRLISSELNRDVSYNIFEHIHNREFSPLLNPKQVYNFAELIQSDKYFKFCFIRNPFSRLLSCYLDKICKNGDPRKKKIFLQMGYDPECEEQISFKDFISCICDQPVSLMDAHWRQQYYQTFQDTIKYDYIGRFESFEKDYSHIVKTINLKEHNKQTEIRHATSSDKILERYYTPDIISSVLRKYKIDFDYFGYTNQI